MEQLQHLMEELTVWSKGQTPLETLFLGFFLSPDDGKPYIAIDGIGDFSAEEGERLWGRFLKFNPIKSKVIQPSYDTYTSGYDGFAALPGNKVQAPMFWTKFDYETVKKSFDKWLVATAKAPTSALYYDFFPLDLMASVPVEATAFAQRTTVRLAMVGIYGFDEAWTLEANQALEDIRACVSSSSTEEARRSIGHLNHSGLSSMDASKKEMDAMGRRAFGPNYPRLQQVKRKYDPDMVFNRWFCVRPADE
ncbi:hypothetical protein FRB98_005522 [Tulasnella sp. 332]|nr:hypothetical protein FRB98_005522 [Tulasnella sp. 332]